MLSQLAWADSQAPQSDEDKAFYALGVMLGQNIDVFSLSEKELSFVVLGLTEKIQGKENKELASFQEKLRDIKNTTEKTQYDTY